MGMDVSGRLPSSPKGEYFRANVWSWHPIHTLITELCSDLLDEEMIESMGFNVGAGPSDQDTCTEMASRFDRWMEHHVNGLDIEVPVCHPTPGPFCHHDKRVHYQPTQGASSQSGLSLFGSTCHLSVLGVGITASIVLSYFMPCCRQLLPCGCGLRAILLELLAVLLELLHVLL